MYKYTKYLVKFKKQLLTLKPRLKIYYSNGGRKLVAFNSKLYLSLKHYDNDMEIYLNTDNDFIYKKYRKTFQKYNFYYTSQLKSGILNTLLKTIRKVNKNISH